MNLNQVTSAQQWFTFDPSTEEWIYYIERLECEISVFSLLNGDGTEAACRTLLLSKLGQQHFCMLVDHFKPRTLRLEQTPQKKESDAQFVNAFRGLAGKCDSGSPNAAYSAINKLIWKMLNRPSLEEAATLVAYTNFLVSTMGKAKRILPYLGWNGVWLSGYRSLKRVKMLKVTPEGGGLGKASPEWKVFADEFDDVFNGKSGAFNAYQATVPKMKVLEKNGRSLVAALEREYLVTLSSGGKRRSLREQPWVGDIVLVVELSTPPSRIRSQSGRIVELNHCHHDVA
ncbi:hypothetical protein T09_13607 [Trichinella sp. T9]|nr:hypothetical protein T09_13607 [Trichinella sp. T9]